MARPKANANATTFPNGIGNRQTATEAVRKPKSGSPTAARKARTRRANRRLGRRPEPRAQRAQPVPASTQGVSLPHTLADVSRAVGVSATTIKYYLNHLPSLVEFEGQSRKRRFSDRALRILQDVRRRLTVENKSLGQIRQELERSVEPGSTPSMELPELLHTSGMREVMASLIGEIRSLRFEVEKMRKTRWLPTE